MRTRANPANILIVDDDEVLGGVLSRVLMAKDRTITQASSSAQALELVEQNPPQLALLDFDLPDSNGLNLALKLRSRHADLPLIMITARPVVEMQYPDIAQLFTRVMTKPPDLQDLRQSVETALGNGGAPVNKVKGAAKPRRVPFSLGKMLRATIAIVVAIAVLGFVAVAAGVVPLPWQRAVAGKQASPPVRTTGASVDLVNGQPHTLAVPEDVRKALGIRKGNTEMIAVAKKPTQTRPLVMPGSTALDTTRLSRHRARFLDVRS